MAQTPDRRRRKGDGYRRMVNGRPRWEIVARIDGKRRTFTGSTQAEAKLRAEEARGAFRPTSRGTVAAYLADWIADKERSRRAQSIRAYAGVVRRYIVPELGDLQLAELTEMHVARLLDGLDLAPASVHQVHAVLRNALETAVRRGLLESNPARLIAAPRLRIAARTTLSEAEARRLVETSRGDPYHALYVLGLTTGMRLGEMAALGWRDIDLEAGRLTVRGTAVTDTAGQRVIREPKTRAAARTIGIPPITVAALREHQAGSTGGLVFPGRRGRPLSPTYLLARFRAALEAAELPRIRLHDLRHTFATLALQRGVPAHVVSAILGHANVGITLGIYAAFTRPMEVQAVDTVQAIFGG